MAIVGYIEFGSGSELIGIIGHLDVVPEGENWTYPPFEAKIVDNKIYGRGSIDDKGPVIASLYAMKAVMDYCDTNSIKLNKRVRLILGLNEERDWKCIDYYKNHEEIPSIGFSPDADFPCIYAEKGLISPSIIMNYSNYKDKDITLTNIDCNNNPLNVVPKYCSCTIKTKKDIDINDVNKIIKNITLASNFNIVTEIINNNELKIISHGIQSHAAHPDQGINAISRLIIILDKLFKYYNIVIPIFDLFTKYIGINFNGQKLNINIPDESGQLTLNVGNFYFENNDLKIGFNLRVPINTEFELVENKFSSICQKFENVHCEFTGIKEPLYVSKDSYLVKTLCEIYNQYTNSNVEPIAIGGATYARAFNNCISFGANLPGQKDMCHQTDEYISIDNLMLACNIYCQAIYKLLLR
ncbi:MAG: Sapep family Mn(2+)-dependent dipeptidase [Clostridia bacterium]|nr:Sapep family Mn(2+)-dependent dipeptidase [Clostridia bacterium]